ncbi:MAG: hypothetical protein JO360_03455, partial [Acidobacteria bacterium]|nr:hypothetical protein [Acidobacteriota bacterium]
MPDAVSESIEVKEKRGARRLESLLSNESATRLIYLSLGAIVITIVFQKLQFSTGSICCGDYDGYYHIEWSRLL